MPERFRVTKVEAVPDALDNCAGEEEPRSFASECDKDTLFLEPTDEGKTPTNTSADNLEAVTACVLESDCLPAPVVAQHQVSFLPDEVLYPSDSSPNSLEEEAEEFFPDQLVDLSAFGGSTASVPATGFGESRSDPVIAHPVKSPTKFGHDHEGSDEAHVDSALREVKSDPQTLLQHAEPRRDLPSGRTGRILRHGSSVSEGDTTENGPYTTERTQDDQLFLFQEDLDEGMKVGAFLSQTHRKPSAAPSAVAQKPTRKLGTIMGVFLPCLQNIFGVLVFIRLPWVIGTAGALEGFFIILMAAATSLLCALSMSAVATNGVVPHGGSYFLIARSLGPELGGAVGFMFAIGQSIAVGMYVVGAVEICVTYMFPQLLIFDKYNCYRLYGSVLLLLLGGIAVVGIRLVNKFALFFLICVLMSITAVILGMFVNAAGHNELRICVLGDRLLAKPYSTPCTKNSSSPLWAVFCTNDTLDTCDPYFQEQPLTEELAFPGMGNSETFYNNSFNHYSVYYQLISDSKERVFATPGTPFYQSTGYVLADLTGSFTVLLSIFFPAVTGIMAGSNRSGDLKNVQKSIPVGTIAAVFFTTAIYIILAFFYCGSVNSLLLRDKYGKSIGGGLVAAEIAWPHPMVVLVGACMATIGAALQTLIGAPRLLLAMSRDNVIDFLGLFSVLGRNGEPTRALLAVLFVAELAICAASIDIIAPILTQCSLICYLFVNLACALQSVIRHPSWRPRFRFYHWSMSFAGAGLAVAIMFISNWYYALIVIAGATLVYKYIGFRGAEKEWGDGWNGLALSTARYSLLRLETHALHTKNWRPQLLVFCRLDDEYLPIHPKLFALTSQLKAGKGLTVFASILEGNFLNHHREVCRAKESLHEIMEAEHVKGFVEVLVASDALTGMNHLIQTAGIGALKHNAVVMCWPIRWRENTEYKNWRIFLDTLRTCNAASCAFLVPKNIASFPKNTEKLEGTIDVWWIVHDGGLLMLLPFLLMQTRIWKRCKMRLFTVAQMEDNTIQIQKDLEAFLYGLRIDAEAHVVEIGTNDISAYTYEKTLAMEHGRRFLREMKLMKQNSGKKRRLMSEPSLLSDAVVLDKKPIIPLAKLLLPNGGTGDHDDTYLTEQSDYDTVDPTTVRYSNRRPKSLVSGVTNDGLDMHERAEAKELLSDLPDIRSRLTSEAERGISERFGGSRPTDGNVRRMHTAVSLNQVIRSHSSKAQLVVLNLPKPPKSVRETREMNYMEFVDELTSGLDRILMVRGAGREVVTIYS